MSLNKIKHLLKSMIAGVATPIRYSITKALNATGTHFCPVCESNVHLFGPAGTPTRANAKCPVCGSVERHRLDWLFFKKQTDLFDKSDKKMLHVAPEEFLSVRFRKIEHLNYLSADISSPKAMVQMDITNINYPDNSFHVIYCSHVLEHIPNDRKAIAELYRVLCPGGWAVLQVPINTERTWEDPTIIDPKDRKKHFGHWDHVRCCGPDYAERMKFVGFLVEVIRSTDLSSKEDCLRMGFQPDRFIFYCKKMSTNKDNAVNE